EPPRPLAELAPGLPGYIAEILEKNLSKSPADRNRSAAELGDIFGRAHAELRSRIGGGFLPIERIFDGYDEILRQRDEAAVNAARAARPATAPALEPAAPSQRAPDAAPGSHSATQPAAEKTRNGTVRMGPPGQPALERTRNGTVRMGPPLQPAVERTRNGTVR